ncbi:MAG: hypothetical protein ABI361_13795 [Nitrososphaera sp.]
MSATIQKSSEYSIPYPLSDIINAVAVNPKTSNVYVAQCYYPNKILEMHDDGNKTSPLSLKSSIELGAYCPFALAVDYTNNRLYVSTEYESIKTPSNQRPVDTKIIDLATGNITHTFPGLKIGAIDQYHSRVYLIADEYYQIPSHSSTITVLDGRTSNQISQINYGEGGFKDPIDLESDPNSGLLYLLVHSDKEPSDGTGRGPISLISISAINGSLVNSVVLDSTANGLALNPDTRTIFVSDFLYNATKDVNDLRQVGAILVMDASKLIIQSKIPVNNLPNHIAIDLNSNRVLVIDYSRDVSAFTLTVVDGQRLAVEGRVIIQKLAHDYKGLAANPTTGTAFAVTYASEPPVSQPGQVIAIHPDMDSFSETNNARMLDSVYIFNFPLNFAIIVAVVVLGILVVVKYFIKRTSK